MVVDWLIGSSLQGPGYFMQFTNQLRCILIHHLPTDCYFNQNLIFVIDQNNMCMTYNYFMRVPK